MLLHDERAIDLGGLLGRLPPRIGPERGPGGRARLFVGEPGQVGQPSGGRIDEGADQFDAMVRKAGVATSAMNRSRTAVRAALGMLVDTQIVDHVILPGAVFSTLAYATIGGQSVRLQRRPGTI